MQTHEGLHFAFVLAAQIRFADRVAFDELLARTAEGDAPGFEDVGAVGDLKRHLRVLLHQQDRRAALVKLPNNVEDLHHQQRRETQ